VAGRLAFLLALVAMVTLSPGTAADPPRLLDFVEPGEVALFRPIDDVVMGGVSQSRFEQAEPGIARFYGEVSLEQGGGFASVRTPPRDWATSGASALLLRVRGDGKRYKLTLRTDNGFDGVQYQQHFTVPAGEWKILRLPTRDFAPSFRGRLVPSAPPLDPARIRAIGFMISDRQAGAFELLVDWIAVER
jgi:hypothetical protein